MENLLVVVLAISPKSTSLIFGSYKRVLVFQTACIYVLYIYSSSIEVRGQPGEIGGIEIRLCSQSTSAHRQDKLYSGPAAERARSPLYVVYSS